jgi:hypothetical protein
MQKMETILFFTGILLMFLIPVIIYSFKYKLIFHAFGLLTAILALFFLLLFSFEIEGAFLIFLAAVAQGFFMLQSIAKATHKLNKIPHSDYFSVLIAFAFIAIYLFLQWTKSELNIELALMAVLHVFMLALPVSMEHIVYRFGCKKIVGRHAFCNTFNTTYIRTIVLLKVFAASKADYELNNFTHRQNLSKPKILNVLGILFSHFPFKPDKCFDYDNKDSFQIIDIRENQYIKAEDVNGVVYELVTREFVTHDVNAVFNYFLLKNGDLTASVSISDKIAEEAHQFILWANHNEYNTVLFNNALMHNADMHDDYQIFDKIYQVNEDSKEILYSDLNKKAPTALIYSNGNNRFMLKAFDLAFGFDSLKEISLLMDFANKMKLMLRKMVWIFRFIQLAFMLLWLFSVVKAGVIIFIYTVIIYLGIFYIQKYKLKWKESL